MEKVIGLFVTLIAYSDTYVGYVLRTRMAEPVSFFDPGLATYIALMVHI